MFTGSSILLVKYVSIPIPATGSLGSITRLNVHNI